MANQSIAERGDVAESGDPASRGRRLDLPPGIQLSFEIPGTLHRDLPRPANSPLGDLCPPPDAPECCAQRPATASYSTQRVSQSCPVGRSHSSDPFAKTCD